MQTGHPNTQFIALPDNLLLRIQMVEPFENRTVIQIAVT